MSKNFQKPLAHSQNAQSQMHFDGTFSSTPDTYLANGSPQFGGPPAPFSTVRPWIQQDGIASTQGVYQPKRSPQFKAPFTPWRGARIGEQIQRGGYSSITGMLPSHGASQFNVPTTPFLKVPVPLSPREQLKQGGYSARPGMPSSNGSSQFKAPFTPWRGAWVGEQILSKLNSVESASTHRIPTPRQHTLQKISYPVVGICTGLIIYALYTLLPLLWHGAGVFDAGFSLHQRLSFLLVYYSIDLSVAVVALALKNLVFKHLNRFSECMIVLGLLSGSELFCLLYSFQPKLLLLNMGMNVLMLGGVKRYFKNHSYSGMNFYLASWLTILVGLAWGIWFLAAMHVSLVSKLLLIITAPLILIELPSGSLQLFECYDIVCRERWMRPRQYFPKRMYRHEPMVSIHVPTYNEPPDMVIETLNVLAGLVYSNYEVILIDNNTKDPAIWMPVQEHCRKLGPKFRFIHVDQLAGAKGGALNYALKVIDPRASIVGVIDADYHAHPMFLKALIGHFDDPEIGFVQTPHDYRDWKGNLFLTMCYWEYKIFFHSAMLSLNERNAGITVGTMCLIRKDALEKAGRWSEWCVTEDSELAIRIHDVGYSSVYVDKTYGRGLIPETFEGYKKQRYRWTAGPVQEFRHHFKHLVGLDKRPSSFTFLQRLSHLNHGLDKVLVGLRLPTLFVAIALIMSLMHHHEIVALPFELWLVATVTIVTTPLLTILLYKATINPSIWEMMGSFIAIKALTPTISYSAFRTSLTGNAAWNRTNKFKSKYSYAAALFSAKEELCIGLILAALVAVFYLVFPYPGLSLMLLIGLSYAVLRYVAAPFMSLVGVWSMKHESLNETLGRT